MACTRSGPRLVSVSGTFSGWDIVRGFAMNTDGSNSGYVLDGFGGLHPVGGAAPASAGYWVGWDIARGVVLLPSSTKAAPAGYVLDGWGGVHPFGSAPSVAVEGYFYGWDIANGLALDPDGPGGYVLDGWGGLHPFGGAPNPSSSIYWPGWDIARRCVDQGRRCGRIHLGWLRRRVAVRRGTVRPDDALLGLRRRPRVRDRALRAARLRHLARLPSRRSTRGVFWGSRRLAACALPRDPGSVGSATTAHLCEQGMGQWPQCSMPPRRPSAHPIAPPSPGSILFGRIVTALLVVGPVVALAIACRCSGATRVHLRDVDPRGRVLSRQRLRRHRRLPPPVHAPQLPCHALVEDRARVGRFARGRRVARRLGREPSPPPRLQRQARRSALAARCTVPGIGGAAARLRARARRLVVQGRPHVGRALRARAARATPTRGSSAGCSRCSPSFSLAAPFFLGWTLSGAIGGALHRAAVGRPGPHGAAAPRDVERELDLPHVRPAAGDAEGSQHELRAARRSSRSARRGTTSTTRTRRRRATVRCAPDRPVGRADPALRTRGLGDARPLADRSATLALPIGLTGVFSPRGRCGRRGDRHRRRGRRVASRPDAESAPARVAAAAVRTPPGERGVRLVGAPG